MATATTAEAAPRARAGWLIGLWLLRIVTAAGLAIDAYVHADLALRYDLNQGSAVLSQGDLFRIEAGVSAFAALAVILTAWRVTWMLAFLVAASALGALLLYRYHDPGAIGPLPDMYEPTMYPEKTLAAVAEGVAAGTALIGIAAAWLISRSSEHRRTTRSRRRTSGS